MPLLDRHNHLSPVVNLQCVLTYMLNFEDEVNKIILVPSPSAESSALVLIQYSPMLETSDACITEVNR